VLYTAGGRLALNSLSAAEGSSFLKKKKKMGPLDRNLLALPDFVPSASLLTFVKGQKPRSCERLVF